MHKAKGTLVTIEKITTRFEIVFLYSEWTEIVIQVSKKKSEKGPNSRRKTKTGGKICLKEAIK